MMEKESEEETKVAEAMKAMEEGQSSTVQTEEKTKVDEAMKPIDEGQRSAVQTEEKSEVDEAMKSIEGQHSVTDPEIKKEDEEKCKVMKSVEVGQHSAQEKDEEEEEVAEAVRALEERQHSVVEIVVVEEQQQQQRQQHHEEEAEQQQQQHHEEEEEQQLLQQQQHHEQEIVEVEEEEEINLGEAIRVMEVGCASWIIEMEETLNNTGRVKKTPSIYHVPDRIKRGNSDAYRPKLVSMGPLHYGEADLMPMERHKKEAVLQRVKRFEKPLVEYLASIQDVADELLAEYDSLDQKWHNECREEFIQMMLMDGCFLLESIERYFDYTPSHPVFSYHGCLTLYTAIQSDIVVMENQLPLLVLDRILAVERETAPSVVEVNTIVMLFLGFPYMDDLDTLLGLHPLDLMHKGMCGPKVHYVGAEWDGTMPCAEELRDCGIRFKSSNSQFIQDISFKNGVLSLPVFKAHDDTQKHVLNLLAFEKLFPCTGHELLSYVYFLDNLVNTGKDVELLRSNGVLKNLLSSDEELAQVINSLGTGAVMSPYSMLDEVQHMVSKHCKRPLNRWRESFAHTYLINPWVFSSLMAAVILLVAAIVQTVYTVLPFYHKS